MLDLSEYYWNDQKSFFSKQWFIFFLLQSLAATLGLSALSSIFIAYNQEFTCNDVALLYNQFELTQNINLECNTTSIDQCQLVSTISSTGKFTIDKNSYHPISEGITIQSCQNFTFVHNPNLPNSITETLNLVCDNEIQSTIANTLFYFGFQLGSLLAGYGLDNYGRKPVIVGSIMSHSLLNFVAYFTYNICFYYIVKLCLGITAISMYLGVYLYLDEFIGANYQIMSSVVVQMSFTAGYGILILAAYYIKNWYNLYLFIAVYPLPGVIYFVFFLPETPKYLFSQGQTTLAKQALVQFDSLLNSNSYNDSKPIKVNSSFKNEVNFSQELSETFLKQFKSGTSQSSKKTNTTLSLFTHGSKLRNITLILSFAWFTGALAFYGLSLNSGSLPVDIYTSNTFNFLTEFVALALAGLLIQKIGYKMVNCLGFVLAGLCVLISTYLNEITTCLQNVSIFENWKIMVAFITVVLSRSAVATCFIALYFMCVLYYPIDLRGNSLGLCSFSARIGGILSPSFIYINKYYSWMTGVMFGSCLVISAILSSMLPKTGNYVSNSTSTSIKTVDA